jgi:KDO2-lipid IV(A) lauroyltransferase
MTEAGAVRTGEVEAVARGTIRQRVLAWALSAASWLACHLPERPLIATAELAGRVWYRTSPGAAAVARENLRQVCTWLVAEGRGPERARRAATDPVALERLVRLAFRHRARYYLEVARLPAMGQAYVRERIVVETPEAVERVFAPGARPVVFVGAHFGSIELPGVYLAARTGRRPVAPMETLADPELQRYFVRTRGAIGVRIVTLRTARRELLAALKRGDPAGIIADRDISGGGIAVPLFGRPAPLPIGPALLALEADATICVAGARRTTPGHYAGGLEEVPIPAEGTRRARIEAALTATAAAFERLIATAPEQWWAVFFPIWPDLEGAAA